MIRSDVPSEEVKGSHMGTDVKTRTRGRAMTIVVNANKAVRGYNMVDITSGSGRVRLISSLLRSILGGLTDMTVSMDDVSSESNEMTTRNTTSPTFRLHFVGLFSREIPRIESTSALPFYFRRGGIDLYFRHLLRNNKHRGQSRVWDGEWVGSGHMSR